MDGGKAVIKEVLQGGNEERARAASRIENLHVQDFGGRLALNLRPDHAADDRIDHETRRVVDARRRGGPFWLFLDGDLPLLDRR